jgi:hypothetical protein
VAAFFAALLQSLVPNAKAATLEIQQFHHGSAAIEKHQQMAPQGIGVHDIFRQRQQAVETLAHVGWLGVYQDARRRRIEMDHATLNRSVMP